MWYIFKDNVQDGPHDEKALSAKLADGTLTRDSFVWREGMAEWLPLYRTDLHQLLPAGTAFPPPPPPAQNKAMEKMSVASRDAWRAFRMLASDPVGKLESAFNELGHGRALGAGLVFGLVFSVCILFGLYRITPPYLYKSMSLSDFLMLVICTITPFVSLVGACFVCRMIFHSKGGLSHDIFIAGASLLPLGFYCPIGGILGIGNAEVVIILGVAAFCLTILMLYSGMTGICGASMRAASIGVPLALVATIWFSKIIYVALLKEYLFRANPFM